jgi:hypothetical protein
MLPPKVLTGLCVLVASVWATSIVLDMVKPDYQPDPAINAIFGGTIGTALTLGHRDGRDDRNNRRGRR